MPIFPGGAAKCPPPPPLVAAQDVVRSDVSIYAGGITWVDAEYDARLGEALRPLTTAGGEGLTHGFEMIRDAREQLADASYLNRLALAPPDRDMTAYETGQRIQEWIRQALPLFEPMEVEYNGVLCDDTFEALMRVGAFGSQADIPSPLRGKQVKFTFESPLHQATDRKKGALFLQAGQMLTEAMQLDPTNAFQVDAAGTSRRARTSWGARGTPHPRGPPRRAPRALQARPPPRGCSGRKRPKIPPRRCQAPRGPAATQVLPAPRASQGRRSCSRWKHPRTRPRSCLARKGSRDPRAPPVRLALPVPRWYSKLNRPTP